jgi:hypothetical protein
MTMFSNIAYISYNVKFIWVQFEEHCLTMNIFFVIFVIPAASISYVQCARSTKVELLSGVS